MVKMSEITGPLHMIQKLVQFGHKDVITGDSNNLIYVYGPNP